MGEADAGQCGRQTPLRAQFLQAALVLAFMAFAAALVLPAFSVRSFGVYAERYSILSGIAALARSNAKPLAAFVFLSSVILPAIKMLAALIALRRGPESADSGFLRLMHRLSRWAMADVFIVALTVIVLNGKLLTTSNVGLGAYLFAASVLVSTAAIAAIPDAMRGWQGRSAQDKVLALRGVLMENRSGVHAGRKRRARRS